MFKEYDRNLFDNEPKLKECKKLEIIKSILWNFCGEYIEEEEKIAEIESLLRKQKVKFDFTNISFPIIIPELDNISNSEKYLQESIKRTVIKKENPSCKIIWKSCKEIKMLKNKNLVILPKTIDYSNFQQGCFGDCYFISCVHALSKNPQLLNFILRLNSKEQENRISKDKPYFMVNFFIDGEWKVIKVKNSFPVFEKSGDLVGVKPKYNEIFLMILEKAWALINGGYDKMEGGFTNNIFELFLGCKCDEFYKDDIYKLYNSIKLNEKFFGTLSLCGSDTYEIKKNVDIDEENFDKEVDIKNEEISGNDSHAYQILKTLEINKKKSKEINDTCKLLIISNPHGKSSELVETGIEKKRIKEILEEEFGKENEDQYKFILDHNDKYQKINEKGERVGTGIIFMPLKYYQDWANSTSVCYCHFDCLSYTCKDENELECLYIYQIKLNTRQSFTCQILLPSFRVHKSEINEFKIRLKKDNKEMINYLILYYCLYGIKIIKNNENFDVVGSFFSEGNENDYSSVRELNTFLEEGEYFIFVYLESSLAQNRIRFLCEKSIDVNLVDKIDKVELEIKYDINSNEKIYSIFKEDNQDLYKKILTNYNQGIFYSELKFKKETFLPGISQCYLHFKKLFEELNSLFKKDKNNNKNISPEDAIYSISDEGDAYIYDIIDPNSMNKIFSEKSQYEKNDFKNIRKYIKNVQTMQFIDNLGYPYKVKNFKELIGEMKINKEPICCLFSEYDEYASTIKSSVVYFKLYHNKAMNQDILVLSDKSKDKNGYLKRNQNPLFIIILDV